MLQFDRIYFLQSFGKLIHNPEIPLFTGIVRLRRITKAAY